MVVSPGRNAAERARVRAEPAAKAARALAAAVKAAAKPVAEGLWQKPFVDAFKLCGAYSDGTGAKGGTPKNGAIVGDVKMVPDPAIAKWTWRMGGSVPAANYLRLPKARGGAGLGLTGRYAYVECRLTPGSYYAFHLDCACEHGNTVRVSVSNLYKTAARSAGGAVRLPLDAGTGYGRWQVVAFDLAGILREHVGNGARFATLKAVQFCAAMSVRSVFTSDNKYSPADVPREMVVPSMHGVGGEPHESAYGWVWLPSEPEDSPEEAEPEPLPRKPEVPRQSPIAMSPIKAALALDAGEAVRVERHVKGPKARPPAAVDAIYATQRVPAALPAAALVGAGGDPYEGTSLRPDPIMSLERIVGCSGERSRNLACAPDGKSLVFGSASTVVVLDATSGAQRFLMGHTNGICSAAFNSAGTLLATAEEGRPAVIRLWDFKGGACVGILSGHERDIAAMHISADGRCLTAVGLDKAGRQAIVVWDITRVLATSEAPVVVRHSTKYSVLSIKFSPFEEDHLVTCGRDSIRFYRLKDGRLRGCSINLGEHRQVAPEARASLPPGTTHHTFTDIAFEVDYGLEKVEERHCFVASASGAVFQVNYGRRTLEAVFQLHNGPINSIIVNEGFCITGSDDRYLRMWPVDFSDYFLEAEHETPVTAVGVTPDGLAIAALTAGGSVGVLDVPSHRYRTLLRSHTDSVFDVAMDPNRNEVTTVSADGSIRVWALDAMEQLYQFDAPDELASCVAYHPSQHCIGVGFDNGVTRVFDIPSTGLVQEHHQHRAAVVDIAFTSDARYMLSAGADGNVCVFTVAQGYLPTKFVATSAMDASTGRLPSMCRMAMAVSSNSLLLAAAGPDVGTVLIFSAGDLTPRAQLFGSHAGIVALRFTPDSREVIATTADARLERFDVATGAILASTPPLHAATLETLDVSPDGRFVAVGAADGAVHVYEASLAPQGAGRNSLPPRQVFVGHVDYITRLRFSPDSKRIVTVGGCDSIYVWSFLASDPELNPPRTEGGMAIEPTDMPAKDAGALELLENGEEGPHGRLDTAIASALQQMDLSGALPEGGNLEELEDELRAEDSPLAADASSAREVIDWLRPIEEDVGDGGAAVAPIEALAERLATEALVKAASAEAEAPHPAVHYAAPPDSAKMELCQVVGYNGSGRHNVLWHPGVGVLAYSFAASVVIEDLQTRAQSFMCKLQADITTLALSPDGRTLASGHVGALGSPAAVCLWDVGKRECTAIIDAHLSGVQTICFSPDGSLLLSAGTSPEAVVAVYSVATGTEIARAEAPAPVHAACWRADSRVPEFVTVGGDALSLWRLPPGEEGAADDGDRDLLVCELAPPASITEPARSYTALTFDESGTLFVGDSEGCVWELELGVSAVCQNMLEVLNGEIGCLTVLGHIMLAAGADDRVIIWTRKEGADSWEGTAAVDVGAQVVAMVMDSACVEGVVGTTAGTVLYLNALEGTAVPLAAGHASAVTCVHEASAAGAIVTGLASGAVAVWSSDNFTRLVEIELENASSATVTSVLASAGGDQVLAGHVDGVVRSFSVREGVMDAMLEMGSAPVVALSWIQQDELLLAVDAACDALVLDASSLAPIDRSSVLRLEGIKGGDQAHSAIADASSRLLAVGYDGAACVAPFCGGTLERGICRSFEEPCGGRGLVTFLPASAARSTLVYANTSKHELTFWDYASDVITRRLALTGVPRSIAASPAGTHLAVGTPDRLVRLVGLEDATWEDYLIHSNSVECVTFIRGGFRLMSAAGEEVAMWEMGSP